MAQKIELKPTEPVREPISKFGGQPVWMTNAQWPIARYDGKPMRFICQIRIPKEYEYGEQKMAYIFMSDDAVGRTWDPDAGDNAVILQPGRFEAHVETMPMNTGPTLQMGQINASNDQLEFVEIEYRVELSDLGNDAETTKKFRMRNRVGGSPGWIQGDDWPKDGPWRFVAQIDSCSEQYAVNFGDGGVGYIFISYDGRRARFCWQCL